MTDLERLDKLHYDTEPASDQGDLGFIRKPDQLLQRTQCNLRPTPVALRAFVQDGTNPAKHSAANARPQWGGGQDEWFDSYWVRTTSG